MTDKKTQALKNIVLYPLPVHSVVLSGVPTDVVELKHAQELKRMAEQGLLRAPVKAKGPA